MKISVEVEEEDKEYLQGVIEQMVNSYYNGHGGTYISFDNAIRTDVEKICSVTRIGYSVDDILKACGSE